MRTTSRFLLVAVLLLPGCAAPPDAPATSGTPGELGRVLFEYSQGCLFGCPLEQPLLAGAVQVINVDGPGDDPGITVSSADPAIAAVALDRVCFCERTDGRLDHLDVASGGTCPELWEKHCDNRVLVQAGKAGTAKLELHDAQGALVDSVAIVVADAATARFLTTYPGLIGEQEGTSLDLAQGERASLRVELFDGAGLELLAPEGVRWQSMDPSVATLSAFTFGAGGDVKAGLTIDVEAVNVGSTELLLSVPGLAQTLPVAVHAP